jgi:hypothetical protein
MLTETQVHRHRFALGGRTDGCGHDSVPPRGRRLFGEFAAWILKMKKKYILAGFLLALLALLAFYLSRDSTTPIGQDPLETLTAQNLIDFQRSFDAFSDGPRIVLLLSPT